MENQNQIFLDFTLTVHVFPDLQMADDAVLLRPVQAAGGGGGEVDGSSNQKVSCRRVTASLSAAVRA